MTLPRPVIPGQTYMVTRRCTQRQLLMRPDDETNRAFEYCLAVAAERFDIELLFTVAMSNHHHTGIYDRDGRYPEFLEYFHKLFAKCQNVLRGRWENFWSSEQTSVVRLESSEDVLDKLVYAISNPVKDQLVERVEEWPGVSSYEANRSGSEKVVTRPDHFFRKDGPMPPSAVLRFVRPRELADIPADQWAALIEQRVRRVERLAAEARRRSGKPVLGRDRVLAQRWQSSPQSREVRREVNPRVASKSMWVRVEALRRNQRFLEAYRRARAMLVAGFNFAAFPEGTYWMQRFMSVVCAIRPSDELLAA